MESEPIELETPDITPAQTLSLLTMIVTELVNASVVDGQTAKLIIGIAGIVVPTIWTLADALIRRGRAHAVAAKHLANAAANVAPVVKV